MGEHRQTWADRGASIDLQDEHDDDHETPDAARTGLSPRAGRRAALLLLPSRSKGSGGVGPDDNDDAGLLDTRPLPALRALPGDTKNGLLALPAPREPAPAVSCRERARRDAWTSAPTWHVPAMLPSLEMEPTRTPHTVVAARPRHVVSRDVRAFCEAPTDKHRALPRALPHGGMFIPGSGRSLQWYRPRLRLGGRVLGGSALALLTCAVLLVSAFLTGPTESGSINFDGLSADASVGLWQAQAGSVPILGGGGAAAPGVHAPGTASKPPASKTPPKTSPQAPPKAPPPPPPPPATAVSAAPFSPWPPQNEWMWVPGYRPYAVTEPRPDPYAVAFGQCTWWAQHERPDEYLRNIGNARYWAAGAQRRGYRVGPTPARGATVVFQPGVQGAGWAGHVAHVLILYPDGWFLVSEMNAYGNGGGWGRVSYRYAHAGPGVLFIY
jgi:hypothetical protein